MLTVSKYSPGGRYMATNGTIWEIMDLASCSEDSEPFQRGDIICWGYGDMDGWHPIGDIVLLNKQINIGSPGGIVLEGYANDTFGYIKKSLGKYLPQDYVFTGLRCINRGRGAKRVYVPSIFSEQVPLP